MQSKGHHMNLRGWIQASRPFSNTNIIFPLLLGQAFAFHSSKSLHVLFFFLILLYGLVDQLFIVFMNDAADHDADILNTAPTLFSGGSRVIPEGKLNRHELMIAGFVNIVFVSTIGLYFYAHSRPLMPLLFTIGLLLLWAYSYAPLKLNYRGGGELLQGIGCGLLLPLIGYYTQAGTGRNYPWIFFIGFALLHTASSIATSLADIPADTIAGKKTLAVQVGNKNACQIITALIVLTIIIGLTSTYFFSLTILCISIISSILLLIIAHRNASNTILHNAAIIGITITYATGYLLFLFF